jgi:hypothetical protein
VQSSKRAGEYRSCANADRATMLPSSLIFF